MHACARLRSRQAHARGATPQRGHALQNLPDDFVLRNADGQDVWVNEGDIGGPDLREFTHVRIRIANVSLQPEKLVRRPWPVFDLA